MSTKPKSIWGIFHIQTATGLKAGDIMCERIQAPEIKIRVECKPWEGEQTRECTLFMYASDSERGWTVVKKPC